MYNQILSYDPASLEFFLRFRSVQHAQEVSTQAGLVSDGAVFENFTLHFDVDTMFEMVRRLPSNMFGCVWGCMLAHTLKPMRRD